MDGLWLSDTEQGPSPWTIAVGATSGQVTKVKSHPGAAYRLLPPKVSAQDAATRKKQKISHRREQDDLILSTPECDELVLEGFYAHARSSAPALLTLTELDGTERVLGATEQSASVNSNSDKALLCANDQNVASASQSNLNNASTAGANDKNSDSVWLPVFGANTLIGLAPLLLLSGGGGSGGSSASGVIGTTPPHAPSITSVTDDVGAITGVVSNGGRSDDTQLVVRVSLTGTGAVANDTVQLYNSTSTVSAAVTLSASNISNGYVDITTNTLSNATTYAFNAKVINALGSASTASANYTVTIDTSAPAAPSITSVTDDVGTITGVVSNGGHSDDTQLMVRVSLTGTNAVANDTLQLYDNTSTIAGAVTLSATDISNGYVDIITNSLSNATTYAFNAKVIDGVGNASAVSSNYSVTIDTAAPATASIGSVTDDVGSITGAVANGGRSDDTQLVVRVNLSGTGAVANDTVQLYDTTTAIASALTLSATDISNGYVDITTNTLIDGTTYSFNATVTDAAGNASAASASHVVTVDTTAPVAPSITRVMDDAGTITGAVADGGRSDDTQLVVRVSLTGTGAVVNDTVQLYDNTSAIANALTLSAADIGNGYVDITTNTLSDATTYTFNAKVTDVAGNASAASGNHSITIDTTAPIAPSISRLMDDVGNLTLSGTTDTSEAGRTVNIGGFNSGTYHATVQADGSWQVTVSAADLALLADQSTLTASLADVYGNTASASRVLGVDKVAPNAPTIAFVNDTVGTITGHVASGGVSDDTLPTVRVSLSGTNAVANDSLQLYNNLTPMGTAVQLTAAQVTAGYVDITTPVLSNGNSYAFNAKLTDVAGNVSTASALYTVTLDTVSPTLAITSSASALKAGETATISFTFSEAPSGFAAGDVTTSNGTLSGLAVTANPKVYTATFTPTAGLASGSASITVASSSYTDAAGNNGGAGTTPSISIDTLAPTLAISSSASSLKTGQTATITFTFSEAPSGFAAGDVTTSNGTLSGLTVTADPKVYTATFTPTASLASGSASITVASSSYTDAAGNNGGAGS